MDIQQLLEKIIALLLEIIAKLAAIETKVDVLYSRHNTTEGYFVQAVFLVLMAAFAFVWYLVRKRDK